ncbi:MAG: DUF2318 domain-containing protein [Dehalococcoidia bacterium]|nr:MAG: DUF2318 domain-containing protein [Dehalococcoidia bacterium]
MKTRRGLVLMTGLAALLLLAACAAPASAAASAGGEPIPATWIDVYEAGDSVTVPLSLVQEKGNTHFSVTSSGTELDFMGYLLDDTLHVRANVCPPCRSRGFTLDGDILVCDTCGTKFDAKDGGGISGPCVDYPKAAAAYKIVDGVVTITLSDLVSAFSQTLVAG